MVLQVISTSDLLRRPLTPPHTRIPLKTLLATRKQTLLLYLQVLVVVATLAVDHMVKILRMVHLPVNPTHQRLSMKEELHILTVDLTAIMLTLPRLPTLSLAPNTRLLLQSLLVSPLSLPPQAHPRDCM